jgi:chromosome segregation ATPase
LKHRLAQAERDLAHYQPSALQFESELRTLRHQYSALQSSAIAAENECRKALGTVNDLQQRLATSEAARQKLLEDNNSYRQRLQKHEITLPTLVREAAQLKSELAVAQNDREHLESEARAIGAKLSAECEEHNRAKELLMQAQAKIALLQNESQSKIAEAEERARHGAEKLAGFEQQIHDLEIRQSALLSKIDFLNRINQRQRDDLRRQSDHIGNLEASNRQLLEGAPPVPFPRNADANFIDSPPQVFRAAGE